MGDGSALSQSLDLVGGTLTGDGWGRRRVGRGLGGVHAYERLQGVGRMGREDQTTQWPSACRL